MKKPTERSSWWGPGLVMVTRLSAWTVMPVLLGYFLGRFIDDRLETEPIMFIALCACAFLVALMKIYRISKEAMDEVSPEEEPVDRNNHPEAIMSKHPQHPTYGNDPNQSTESDNRDSSFVP